VIAKAALLENAEVVLQRILEGTAAAPE